MALTKFEAGLAPHVSADSLNSIIGLRPVNSVAELEALTGARENEWLFLTGYFQADGRGAGIVRRTTSGATVNGGTVFASAEGGNVRWERLLLSPDTIHVDEWGCKGDDSSFNNRTRLEAIASRTNTRGYGVVVVGDQTYWHGAGAGGNTGDVYVFRFLNCSSVVVRGQGRRSGLKYQTANSFLGQHIRFENCGAVQVESIVIDSNWTTMQAETFGNRGISCEANTKRLSVRDCTFRQITDLCIYDSTRGSSDTSQTDAKQAQSIIIGNRFEAARELYNVKPGGGYDGVISDNIVVNCSGGFKIDGEIPSSSPYATRSGRFVVGNNVFEGMSSLYQEFSLGCIAVQEWIGEVIVSGNVVSGSSAIDGIQVMTGQTGQSVRNVKIMGNILRNFTNGTPILVENQTPGTGLVTEGIEISHNTVDATYRSAIMLRANAGSNSTFRDIKINDNIITDPGLLSGSATYSDGITVRLDTSGGTVVSVDGLEIKNNLLVQRSSPAQSGRFGIRIEGAGSLYGNYALIENNRFKGFATAQQLSLASSNSCVVKANQWEDSTYTPELHDMPDSSFTLAYYHPPVMRFATLAAGRTVTLPATSTSVFGHGQRFRFVKEATTGTLTIGSFTALGTGRGWMEIEWDGNAVAWRQVAQGTLS